MEEEANRVSAGGLRDEGIERVLSHNADWKREATRQVVDYLVGREVTGEDIRVFLLAQRILPDHPNAWGGFIYGLTRRGILIDTGRTRNGRTQSSHARRNPVWYVKGERE